MDETSVTEISDVRCARSWISIAYQVDKRGTGRRRSSSPGPWRTGRRFRTPLRRSRRARTQRVRPTVGAT